jgi:putative membrane protein insertion efficiency factor
MKHALLLPFFYLAMLGLSQGQVFSDEDLHIHRQQVIRHNPYAFEPGSQTLTGNSIGSLFKFYKHFISSQDASSCSFHPSCSVYFVDAVKVGGLLKGTLLFGDRFMRCNSLSKENYPIYEDYRLLYDPVPADF